MQYAKRVVGRKVYGGVNTHFPLRVNTAGVMPIIFAQAIMFIPNTFFSFFPESETMIWLQALLNFDSVVYWIIYGLIIVFFTYFYTAIILNPVEVADNLKKQGGFIPGVRPGKKLRNTWITFWPGDLAGVDCPGVCGDYSLYSDQIF